MEIMLGAKIGKNIQLHHPSNIIITHNAEVGENFICLHNVTIGQNTDYPKIKIGNNCIIGAGTIILGGIRTIGDSVTIGAMSFINKDLPDNCTVYTEKTNKIIQKIK